MAKLRNSKLVYSTDGGSSCKRCGRSLKKCTCPLSNAGNKVNDNKGVLDGVVRLHRDSKGRKGKGVTLIKGLELDSAEVVKLAKTLKSKCGVGGAVKEGVIELQSADRENIKTLLEAMGHTVKIAGG